jgi:hypothetical protein
MVAVLPHLLVAALLLRTTEDITGMRLVDNRTVKATI